MSLPWWVWGILGLWCGPAVYCTIVFLVQKPIPQLTDQGELIEPLPLRNKIRMFPLLLVLLIAMWPSVVWVEMREDRRLVKIMKFPIGCVVCLAAWPLLLWREIREGSR